MIHVLSTGLTNTPARHAAKTRCLMSVAAQRGVTFRHEYIEAFDQNPRRGSMQNEYEAIMRLDPHDIVVQVDGDDWLAHPMVLAKISALYNSDPDLWLTYGSFACSNGVLSCSSAYTAENYREVRWRGSHLKTFRAGLAQRIDPKRDLRRTDGTWRTLALDHCTMFPMLEMSGLAHQQYISEVLYVYNVETAWETGASETERELERTMAREIRALPPYRSLDRL